MENSMPKNFVILGGGTAGWMAACMLAKSWPQHKITVIESPDIGIVGVGEGSTPQIRSFFKMLDISEAEWMPKCNATYKAGISFHGWSNRPGYERYFHPFITQLDSFTAPQFYFHTRARRTGRDVWAHPDRFFFLAKLARENKAPVPPDNFPFEIGYGYHFDAQLVGRFLRDHAESVLGITHLERTIRSVALHEDGSVKALIADDAEEIAGDFFIDCSGFRGTIIQQAMQTKFLPFSSNLFNDRAVAMPTANEGTDIASETKATALSNGWAWHIPLTNRAGNGYVYSSKYTEKDVAETELRTHLGLLDSDVEARHLTMNVGRLENSWVKNCLAVGLSQSFIEPLEATALHIVQSSIMGFIEAYEHSLENPNIATRFNTEIGDRIEGIRDYIVAHYRMNQRQDTQYWRDNAENQNLSDALKAVMTCWFTGGELEQEIERLGLDRYYSALSWHCLLAGYGSFPDDAKMQAVEAGLPIASMEKIDEFVAGCAANFTDHATFLDR
jgi:tryptophan 6-halogenase